MEPEMDKKLICQICEKGFSSTSSRNRHVRDFHPKIEQPTQKKQIMCPMCPNEQKFRGVYCLESTRKRQVNYACDVKKKHPNGEEDILYNKSDSRGFVSLCKKRRMKSGGSIRIRGMCPSRIKVKMSKNGNVMVKFTETHVGHDELRNERLLKDDKNLIVGQLTAGVTSNKLHNQNDVTHLSQKNSNRQEQERSLSFKEIREIGIAEMSNFSRSLDENEFENLMAVFTVRYLTQLKGDLLKKQS